MIFMKIAFVISPPDAWKEHLHVESHMWNQSVSSLMFFFFNFEHETTHDTIFFL